MINTNITNFKIHRYISYEYARARDIHLTESKKGFQKEARALPLPRTYG
jgi:hypothetical protein